MHVLVVDNMPSDRRFVAEALRARGATMSCCARLSEAWELLPGVDAVLIDGMLADVNVLRHVEMFREFCAAIEPRPYAFTSGCADLLVFNDLAKEGATIIDKNEPSQLYAWLDSLDADNRSGQPIPRS